MEDRIRFPAVYIGYAVSEGWGTAYPTVVAETVKDVREFIASYSDVKLGLDIGLDIRSVDQRCFNSLLKLLEDSRIKLRLRISEPVLPTIISRAGTIFKKDRIELESIQRCLIVDDGGLGSKIRGLFK